MNNLLTVNDDTRTILARDLHETLNIEKRFSAWFETNAQGFIEGEDYTSVLSGTVVNNGAHRDLQDYALTIDMAKHICLMSRTERGKQCRQYLIDLEKAWNTPEQILARALKVADKTIANLHVRMEEQAKQITEMKPKADFFDAVTGSKDAVEMATVAKVLDMGIGRNKLFQKLREMEILRDNNTPYQQYVDRGYFRVIEQKYIKPDGETCINIKTLVYQSGVDYIRKKLVEAGVQEDGQ